MERICNKVKNYKEVENWDIEQHLGMTPEERKDAVRELRKRV